MLLAATENTPSLLDNQKNPSHVIEKGEKQKEKQVKSTLAL